MENADDIEEFYKHEIERIDREYLEDFKKYPIKISREKDYKEKLNKARIAYELKYKKFIDEQKRLYINEKKKAIKKEKNKEEHFTVKRLNLELSIKEKISLKWEMFRFKFKINFRKIFHKLMPNFLIRGILKTRLFFKLTYNEIKRIIKNIINMIKKFILSLIKLIIKIIMGILRFIKKIILNIFTIVSKIFKKILKRKKEEVVVEKRPDELIAEKLLQGKKE
ncbi:MAG: hypothetical protein WC867_07100 [Candidatus Pacearchaeota archaeon]|jgi:hypothetical protein